MFLSAARTPCDNERVTTHRPSTGEGPPRSSQTRSVALLTALPKEFDAIVQARPGWREQMTSRSALLRKSKLTIGDLDVVAACAMGMGQTDAAIGASELVRESAPDLLVLVGICAGISPDVQLGDVCVSEQVVDYELAKLTPARSEIRWDAFRSPAPLVADLRRYASNEWVPPRYDAPPGPDYEASAHIGTILSGNKVVADDAFVSSLRETWRRAVAFEMESAGVARQVDRTNGPPFVMVKSVCDKGDSAKGDDWQQRAADTAANFVLGYLESREAILAGPWFHRPFDDIFGRRAQDVGPTPNPYRLTETDALILLLKDAFSTGELRVLVAAIEEDWDEIPGETKSEKAASLVVYLRRRQKMPLLRAYIERERPLLWDSRMA